MNANELADELQRIHNEDIVDGVAPQLVNAIDMLRKQQAEIEALNRELLRYKSNGEMGYANEQ